ncbi:DUF1349 domain-containing protein [Microbacterium sp. HD4P20]|uniref:DUF1349 domain-containing protein n=1 Tax=Microbacterium sp. HD4P20 TaxID=2864874 RepID=UPI001C6446C5|nr:DUF1349 domain-containing protein [Microbacterium sp. HD4P20]MCP2635951.1 DUF1349 domain-containing protein [Microbacterium sp. HD4P20]
MRTTARRRASVVTALGTAVAAVVAGVLAVPAAHAQPAVGAGTAMAAGAVSTAVAPPPEGWPEFGYQGVITDKPNMDYNPTNEYIFPSIFHAGAYFDDPLGEWYLYLAPHDSPAGVMLMYADSLEGPWTEYEANPIIASEWLPHYDVSHTSSPDAIWNEQAGKQFMYFHGENSVTRYATSDDGIHFEYGDIVVSNAMGGPNVTESSYARVFEHPDEASEYEYGMFYMGNERDNIRRIRLAESVDGITWTVDPDYVVAPGAEEGQNVSAANLWEWDGQLYVIYHASSGKSYARTIDATLRDVGEVPIILHQASGVGADVGRVAAPEVVTHEDETYLFYESGDRLGATIAWAKDGAEPVVEIPTGFPADPENPVFDTCAAAGSDEFAGSLSETWDRVVREDAARHAVEDGKLVIPTYTGGVAAAPLLQQELPEGPWQLTAPVGIDPTQTFQQAGLLLYASDTHYAKFDLGRATPGRTVEFVYHRNGSNRQDSSPPAVPGATKIWLRLTSDGTQITASASYDGAVFANFGRPIPVAEAGFTHVGPFAFRGSTSAPEITGAFDWFRWSPTVEEYEQCLVEEPPLPPDSETTSPGAGVLSSTSGWAHGLEDGNFELRWNMWWGANAARLKVYENGELIHTADLTPAGPAPQSVVVPVAGRGNGDYVYTAEAINSRGASSPAPLTVKVTDAAPGVPRLSTSNRDGDGSFTITANMWWGTNASAWRLFEDDIEIASGALTAASPAAQRVEVPVDGRSAGEHRYVIEFTNPAGATRSDPLVVRVNGG